MSFRAAKVRKPKKSVPHTQPHLAEAHPTLESCYPSPSASTSYTLIEPDFIRPERRGYGTRGKVIYAPAALVVLPNRQVFTQVQSHTHPTHHHDDSSPACLNDSVEDTMTQEVRVNVKEPQIFVTNPDEPPELLKQRRRRQKERQWAKWTNDVIPSLIIPHLQLLNDSESFRNLHQVRTRVATSPSCSCIKRRRLKVVCVYFECQSLWLFKYFTTMF
jgi:hypothetical protein